MAHGQRRGSSASAGPSSTGSSELGKRKNRLSGSLSHLILQTLEAQNLSRKGLSLAALKKLLAEAGYNVRRNNSRLKRELHNLVSSGLLVRVSGSGASGSFKRSSSRERKATGKSQKGKRKKAAGNKEPTKKPRKTQSAVNKPKGLQSRTSAALGRKRLLNKHPSAERVC
ncbi:histone H1-like [Varanus komodoensis]|uniref:histone H1-like n=1 Tax=Varanus komodoensis TaxID=61221 RepID=UPI001CF7A46E|nr:histone H1-like [Varanus komodoensis]